MIVSDIRNWLGLYFLGATMMFGAYFILCPETPMLPLSRSEAHAAFAIVVPVLMGQLTMIFRWFGNTQTLNDNSVVPIPTWVVKGPPFMVSVLLVITIGLAIVGNIGEGKSYAPSPEAFRTMVTFSMSILNATTIFIVTRFFDLPKGAKTVSEDKP